MLRFASGFFPTSPRDNAVAAGSRLLPTRPAKDFHLQSSAHARHTRSGYALLRRPPKAHHNDKGSPAGRHLSKARSCSDKLSQLFVPGQTLSNLVLDDLDKELARRGHRFCRYADDCNIYVRSRRAGERVMASVSRFLTKKLRLKVNEAKSAVARPEERKFLGSASRMTGASGASRRRPSTSSRRRSGT